MQTQDNESNDSTLQNNAQEISVQPQDNESNDSTVQNNINELPDSPFDSSNISEAEEGFIPAAEIIENDDDTSDIEDNTIYTNLTEDASGDTDELKLPNPVYEITSIHISGNIQTSRERILKMMGVAVGDRITLDDLEDARIKLAVGGVFKTVDISLNPGPRSGTIDVRVDLLERSNLQINNYWIGSSDKSPFWMGLDATWLAPFSLPHRMNFAFAATSDNDYSFQLGYLVPSVARLPLSLSFSAFAMQSHEQIFGSVWEQHNETAHTLDNAYIDDLAFKRHGLSIGVGVAPHEHLRILARIQYAYLHQSHKNEATDSVLEKMLKHGDSHLPVASVTALFDNRSGRNMPASGHFAMLSVAGTAESAISDYEFIRVSLFHQSNFQLYPGHILRIQTNAGLIHGNAPFFEKFFYNDYYSLAPSRFLHINASSRGAYDIFKTGTSSLSYEDYLVHLALTYAWQPWTGRLELFATAAATYADSSKTLPLAIGIRPDQNRSSFPIDMSFNAGVRFETSYGLFSLTLAHIFNFIRE